LGKSFRDGPKKVKKNKSGTHKKHRQFEKNILKDVNQIDESTFDDFESMGFNDAYLRD